MRAGPADSWDFDPFEENLNTASFHHLTVAKNKMKPPATFRRLCPRFRTAAQALSAHPQQSPRPFRLAPVFIPAVLCLGTGFSSAKELFPVGGGDWHGDANLTAAQTFWSGPGNVTWKPLGVTDVAGDYAGGSPKEYDFVGDPSSRGLFWASTSAYVFFRMRVDVADVTNVADWSGSHFLVIDVVGVGNSGIDYGFAWDGANAGNVLEHGLEMQVPTSTSFNKWSEAMMNDMDNSMKTKSNYSGL